MSGRSATENGLVGDTRLPRLGVRVVCPFMTTSTRTRSVLVRAGLVLAMTAALAFSSACNDSSPLEGGTGGNLEQEDRDDNGDDEQDD